nr:unnamed protein product [Callosobruchus analis]
MLALVDSDNKCVAVDIESYGREGDAGIYLKNTFGQQILKKEFPIPPPQALPEQLKTALAFFCAFFRIFFQPIATHPETTDKLIMCAYILYNLLSSSTNNTEKYPLPTQNLLPLS